MEEVKWLEVGWEEHHWRVEKAEQLGVGQGGTPMQNGKGGGFKVSGRERHGNVIYCEGQGRGGRGVTL